jgi:hypothetical protein
MQPKLAAKHVLSRFCGRPDEERTVR